LSSKYVPEESGQNRRIEADILKEYIYMGKRSLVSDPGKEEGMYIQYTVEPVFERVVPVLYIQYTAEPVFVYVLGFVECPQKIGLCNCLD
jgi:hypothetical protein